MHWDPAFSYVRVFPYTYACLMVNENVHETTFFLFSIPFYFIEQNAGREPLS